MPKAISQARDFSIDAYRDLLSAIKQNCYEFYCFNDLPFLTSDTKHHVLLRHDVDRMPSRALRIAEMEAEEGVRSTFFFRTKPVSFNKDIIRSIQTMGHEIGYHYECLSDTRGDVDEAWRLFQQELKKFEDVCEIKSIAMHGRPLLPFDNRDLWNYFNYHDIGINIEAYRNVPWDKYEYFTDVGGSWDCESNLRDYVPRRQINNIKFNSTPELIDHLTHTKKNLIISTHPERWPETTSGWIQARVFDFIINQIKKLIGKMRT